MTDVRRPDGVTVATQEAGDPNGPPVLFLHGFGFCGQVFARQLASPRLAAARLVTMDLRGHGGTGVAPGDEVAIGEGTVLADDLAAVVDTLGLDGVTVVAWSYSGLVLGHYLAAYGPDRVRRVNLVAAAHRAGPDTLSDFGPDAAPAGLWSTDPAERAEGAAAFVAAGEGDQPLGAADTAWLEGLVLRSDPAVLLGYLTCIRDYGPLLQSLDRDLLLTHGTADRINLPVITERAAGLLPTATVSWYDGSGHLPFLDQQERFDDELARIIGI